MLLRPLINLDKVDAKLVYDFGILNVWVIFHAVVEVGVSTEYGQNIVIILALCSDQWIEVGRDPLLNVKLLLSVLVLQLPAICTERLLQQRFDLVHLVQSLCILLLSVHGVILDSPLPVDDFFDAEDLGLDDKIVLLIQERLLVTRGGIRCVLRY